jgi:hypothetical protein
MSALPPKADIRQRSQNVCFGPKCDIGYSINSSAATSRPGGTVRPRAFAVFHVDDSFVLGRRLNGKIDRFSAAQDAVDIGRHLSKLIYGVGAGQDV